MTYRIDPATVATERAEHVAYDDWDADDGPYQLAATMAERAVTYYSDAWAIVNAADGGQCNDADEHAAECWDGEWQSLNDRMTHTAYWIVYDEVLRVLDTLAPVDA